MILQDRDAFPRQRRRHLAIVVVVAENGEDAIRRSQRREELGNRPHEVSIAIGHVVAAEDNEIRIRRQRQLDGARDILRGDDAAVVNVGEERDAQTVERGR